MLTKNIALAASITMLAAISGLTPAGAAGPHTRDWLAAPSRSDQQLGHAFDASYPATQAVETNSHRYHGGPKSND